MEVDKNQEETHRQAVLETLQQEFSGAPIIYLTVAPDGQFRANWSRNLHPLAVAGILEAMGDSVRQQYKAQAKG